MITVIYNLSITLWEKTPEVLKDVINKLNLRIVIIEEVRDEYNCLITIAAIYVTVITEIIKMY